MMRRYHAVVKSSSSMGLGWAFAVFFGGMISMVLWRWGLRCNTPLDCRLRMRCLVVPLDRSTSAASSRRVGAWPWAWV